MSATVVLRDPAEEGEWETGCFYWQSNNLALVATSWPMALRALEELFKLWDDYMKTATKRLTWTSAEQARNGSLKWLLANAGNAFDHIRHMSLTPLEDKNAEREREAAIYRYIEAKIDGIKGPPDPTLAEWEPDEIRDWFCWLHRYMVQTAKEEALYERS